MTSQPVSLPRDAQADNNRADALDEAQDLVLAVLGTLNGTKRRCDACGLSVLEDLDDGRKIEQLRGIAEKLERLIGGFRTRGGV